jgi:hypothetical protein
LVLRGLRFVPNAKVQTYSGQKKIGAILEEAAEEEGKVLSADLRKNGRYKDAREAKTTPGIRRTLCLS